MAFLLKGTTFTDPIDGRSFRKFLPYGYENQRANALAPSTFSLERHRLLWLYLKNETNFFSTNQKVLHIAPEQCFLKRFKRLNNLDLITADLYSPIADVKADICDLPFESNVFDLILCNHVLEHIEDDGLALRNMLGRVQKGGKLALFVPALTCLYGSFDRLAGHYRRYSRAELLRVLSASGWQVSGLEYVNLFGIFSWFIGGRILQQKKLDPELQSWLVDFVKQKADVDLSRSYPLEPFEGIDGALFHLRPDTGLEGVRVTNIGATLVAVSQRSRLADLIAYKKALPGQALVHLIQGGE